MGVRVALICACRKFWPARRCRNRVNHYMLRGGWTTRVWQLSLSPLSLSSLSLSSLSLLSLSLLSLSLLFVSLSPSLSLSGVFVPYAVCLWPGSDVKLISF